MVLTAGTLKVRLEGYHCRPERAAVSSGARHRVVSARTLDEREVKVWTIPLERTLEVEVQHILDLWEASGEGALPVDWQAPGAGSAAPYYFDMQDLEVVQTSAIHSSIVLVLRERVI